MVGCSDFLELVVSCNLRLIIESAYVNLCNRELDNAKAVMKMMKSDDREIGSFEDFMPLLSFDFEDTFRDPRKWLKVSD